MLRQPHLHDYLDSKLVTELRPDLTCSPIKSAVLIIDDDPLIQTLMSQLLGDPLEVLTASSAREGLGILADENNISVVLLDLQLPDLNGLEVLRRIRGNERTRGLNVVVLTASSKHEWVVKSANMDIQGYFEKPFDGAALCKRIMSLSGDDRIPNYMALRALWGDNFEMRLKSVGLTVKGALDYVEANHHKTCRRENIAAHLEICPDYLSRLFKEKCGVCLNGYITRCRLQLSQDMLVRHPRMKIKNIAQYAGFPDVDYFCKVFKKQTGNTPKEYREQSMLLD